MRPASQRTSGNRAPDKLIEKIEANGWTLISKPDSNRLNPLPDGTIAEIVDVGRYQKMREKRSESRPYSARAP
jgi:hypothetical protein